MRERRALLIVLLASEHLIFSPAGVIFSHNTSMSIYKRRLAKINLSKFCDNLGCLLIYLFYS